MIVLALHIELWQDAINLGVILVFERFVFWERVMRRFLLVALTLALANCGRSEQAADMAAPAMKMNTMDVAADAATPEMEPAPPAAPKPGNPVQNQNALIAYSYSMSLELPAKSVISLRDAHLKACTSAGPAKCQLLGASSTAVGDDDTRAMLQLRGEPQWLEAFRTRITSDTDTADGRLLSNTIGSEDLTRQIVDTEATLGAQTKLRDRLTDLLVKHNGKLGDLLEVERELARVQGVIDAQKSELAVMRTRVNMSALDVSYQSRGVAVSDRTADPTLRALRAFLDIMSESFAALIRLFAGLLPWLVVLIPTGWLIRRSWRIWRTARAASKAAQ
jgi:Domain of unknown function (DUF4349)